MMKWQSCCEKGKLLPNKEQNQETCQTSKMELLAKIVKRLLKTSSEKGEITLKNIT